MSEHISEMNGESVWPQLYASASTGKTKTWQIRVKKNQDGTATVISTYGQLGGKLQDKVEIIREGKNLGKSNETTPYEQAVNEAQSDYVRKKDKKYTPEIPGSANYVEPNILLPMLALDYRKRSHNVVFPAYGQTKLDGIRGLAEKTSPKEVIFTSRKNKEFPLGVTAHLVKPLLERMDKGEIQDGEFYIHGWMLQELSAMVKKPRENAEELQFHVFDLADKTVEYARRAQYLADRYETAQDSASPIQFVPAELVHTREDVKRLHDAYVLAGYEGIIVRNAAGLYLFDHRSKDLQKYKEFDEEEFVIVGGKAEVITDPKTHAEVQAIVFKCEVSPGGSTFDVRPKGSVAYRVKMFANLATLIGKELTVKFQGFSTAGLPLFPVGKAIRDYE
jgi:DNA ligase-1